VIAFGTGDGGIRLELQAIANRSLTRRCHAAARRAGIRRRAAADGRGFLVALDAHAAQQ